MTGVVGERIEIVVDGSVCTHCGLCASVCPTLCLEQKGTASAVAARPETCVRCGHCVMVCPTGAVKHSAVRVKPVEGGALPNPESMMALLRSRRSIRRFREQPIQPAHWELLLEAAALAPTAHNVREVRLIVIEDTALLKQISRRAAEYMGQLSSLLSNPVAQGLGKVLPGLGEVTRLVPEFLAMWEALKKGEDPVFHGAPGLIVAHAEKVAQFGETDCALALHSMTLAGEAAGVKGFYSGYVTVVARNDPQMRRLLGIPKGHQVHGAMVVGYPAVHYKKMVERDPVPVVRM